MTDYRNEAAELR